METNVNEQTKLAEEITKLQLEKQILQKDLDSYDDRLGLERKRVVNDRRRFMWETIRLLGIAVITGVIGYLSTFFSKSYELNEARKNLLYQQFINDRNKFSQMESQSLNQCKLACQIVKDYTQLDIADVKKDIQQFEHLCSIKDSLLAIASQGKLLDSQVTATARPADHVLKKIDSLENKKRILEQSATTASTKKEVKKIEDSLSSLINAANMGLVAKKSEELTSDYIDKTTTINQISSNELKSPAEKKMASGYPRTSWFKEGYFLVFDDMKIYLSDLNNSNQTITVDICHSTTAAPCSRENLILESQTLSKSKSLSFSMNNAQYKIRLDHIGNAGSNPFTKAAYIIIEKYE